MKQTQNKTAIERATEATAAVICNAIGARTHTAGLWNVKPFSSADSEGLQIRSCDHGDLIARVIFTEWMNKAESQANAALIAAAPDLLRILKAATADAQQGDLETHAWFDEALEIIYKAENATI